MNIRKITIHSALEASVGLVKEFIVELREDVNDVPTSFNESVQVGLGFLVEYDEDGKIFNWTELGLDTV